jgi:hypothetical protein
VAGYKVLTGRSTESCRRNSGAKFFTDDTLLQGTTSATYIIQGHRGTVDGDASEQVSVQFGVSGPGIVATGATVRMAA